MNLPAEERLDPVAAAQKLTQSCSNETHFYLGFPRPQCDNEVQVDQIIDILDRARVVKSSHFRDGESNEELQTVIEIDVRKPSDQSKRLISPLLLSVPALDGELCCSADSGTIVLTYQFEYKVREWERSSGLIRLFTGPPLLSGEPDSKSSVTLCDLKVESGNPRFKGNFDKLLLALRSRLLDGAPASESAQISEQQFMSLLLLLSLGDQMESPVQYHFSHFAGYFAEDGYDQDYPET